MLKKLRKSNQGFTIIEVLIVLAIAGLIMLIVFLAVPALQRNSRNTQRKNDVAAILGAVSEFVNNNNGSLPDHAKVNGNTVNLTIGAYSGTNTGTPANLGIVSTVPDPVPYSAGLAPSNVDTVVLVSGATCNGNSYQAGSARTMVALYAVEPGVQAQCSGS